jgi:hypothetical protein
MAGHTKTSENARIHVSAAVASFAAPAIPGRSSSRAALAIRKSLLDIGDIAKERLEKK